ncbi:MAG: AMP-binding protein, partial [Thermodesulfobacteriota bacterium]|nr:AMP-binding protein [Thermodesulfobacteriota bacterium]
MARSRKENIFFNQARETLSWEERRERLNENFLATWSHVWGRSRAYRDFYREAGVEEGDVRSLDDLPGLPILRMADLVERQKKEPPFGGFETVDPKEIRRVYINPGLIFQPGDWDYRDTSWAEALCGAGFKEGDRVINTFNYHLWPFAFMLDDSLKMIGATVIPAGAGNTMMQVRIMGQLKVNGFLGTPSFLMTLAERAEGMGLDVRHDLSLETVMVGAEMLSESLRTRLEDKMGISVRQCYGTVFLGCIGYECPYMEGLHVPDNNLVEVVDPHEGRPVRPGATGEIVATNFSPTYPFIRLATGDLSLLSREPCSCGRTGPMLKKVLGRIDQATKVRGTFIHPWQADEVIAHYPE